MTSATITTATVKYPAREPKDWGYGLKINAIVTATNGEEIKLWGKPEDTAIASLKKGQSVQLIHDGKSYKLIQESPKSLPGEKHEPWDNEKKKAIANQISQNADLLAFCLQIAKTKFVESGLVQSEESMRSLATTLFIQAQKSL
jgi:hypothetical protein